MHTRAPAEDGVGFAIPLTPAKRRIIGTLAAGKPVIYGYVGATVRTLEPEERAVLGSSRGVVVEQLDPDGPAATAGLEVGDLVVALDDQAIHGTGQLAELVGECAVGAVIQLALIREGRSETVPLTVGERDPQRISLLRNPLPEGLPSAPRPAP
jgi:serine protease Do